MRAPQALLGTSHPHAGLSVPALRRRLPRPDVRHFPLQKLQQACVRWVRRVRRLARLHSHRRAPSRQFRLMLPQPWPKRAATGCMSSCVGRHPVGLPS